MVLVALIGRALFPSARCPACMRKRTAAPVCGKCGRYLIGRRGLRLQEGQGEMTALVTGAGKRLGRAMALYLAGRGHDVAVHYATSREEAEAVVAEIRAMGRRAADLAGRSAGSRRRSKR